MAALAYRAASGERGKAAEACWAATEAFVVAGGAAEVAARDVPLIVAAVARDHPARVCGPVRERIAREERWWKARGVWSPPKDRSR